MAAIKVKIVEHNSKPRNFKLPEQAEQLAAYNAEMVALQTAQRAAAAKGLACEHNIRDTSQNRVCQPGDTSRDCMGLVAVCGRRDKQPEDAAEVATFVSKTNAQGRQFVRRELTKQDNDDKAKAAKAERDRNPAAYLNKVASHVPDMTWSGNAQGPFMPMENGLNVSIGQQARTYPVGYVAMRFAIGTWVDKRCTAGTES